MMNPEGIGPSEEELGIKPAERQQEAELPEIFEKAKNEREIESSIDAEVSDIVERTGLRGGAIQFLVEANRAGKSFNTLAELTSRQEKKPVFVINNARQGAFLQLGFRHWLANFHSQEQAEEFIGELHRDEEYAKTERELKEKIEALRRLLSEFIADIENQSFNHKKVGDYHKYQILTDLQYNDPADDVNLELLFELPSISASGEEQCGHYDYFKRNYPELNLPDTFEEYISGYVWNLDISKKIAFLLTEIMMLKDELRATVLQQAKQWIDDSRIESFVYPINHYKASSSGPTAVEGRLFRKIGATLSEQDTIFLFGDVHLTLYSRFGGDRHRSAMNGPLGMWGKYVMSQTNNFATQLRGHIRSSARIMLEYPGTEAFISAGNGYYQPVERANYETALRLVGENHPKMVDVWVLTPLQRKQEKYDPDHFLYPRIGHSEEGTSPDDLRRVGLWGHNYQSINRMNYISLMRQEVERLKGNPPWVRSLTPRIFHEANYTIGGPEDEEFLGEAEIEEGKNNE